MQTRPELEIPLDDFEYDELETFLLALESDEAVFNMSEFDGFITAIASSPEPVPPSEWMPVIWGGAEHAPRWESAEDYQRIADLMLRHLNTTALTLMDDPDGFQPWFMENEVEGHTYPVVDDWCIGYMKAVMLRPQAWRLDDPDAVERMAPIPLFSDADCWDFLERLADRHIEYLQQEIRPVAQALHDYWQRPRERFMPPEGVSVH